MYSALMPDEAERSDVRFEVPDHDGTVSRATDHLTQVGVESRRQNTLLVSLKRPFKRRLVK